MGLPDALSQLALADCALVWRRKVSFILSYATIMGNAGAVLTVVLQQSFDLTARSAPVSQRAEQTQRLPPLAFRCCCNLSSALSVRHLCHEEYFFYGLERVLREAHSSRKGSILLIHNSCCISSATGKLSSMFHGLAM